MTPAAPAWRAWSRSPWGQHALRFLPPSPPRLRLRCSTSGPPATAGSQPAGWGCSSTRGSNRARSERLVRAGGGGRGKTHSSALRGTHETRFQQQQRRDFLLLLSRNPSSKHPAAQRDAAATMSSSAACAHGERLKGVVSSGEGVKKVTCSQTAQRPEGASSSWRTEGV